MLYDKHNITHIRNVDHPESLSVSSDGKTAYATGTGCQVYRINLARNQVEEFARTNGRCLGQAIDADGNLYAANCAGEGLLKITPEGAVSEYARGPGGRRIQCANYPAFDRQGNIYLSESGDWSGKINGYILKIAPGGGNATLWHPHAVDSPNAVALDADEKHLYFVETYGNAVARIAINPDGSAGDFERVVHMPRHIPDGIAFDTQGRLWIACHRPDAIYIFDLLSRRLELFCEDWAGEQLRGPTDVVFAGPNRDIVLAASLDNLVVHRFDDVNVQGLKLNYPKLPSDGA